MAKLKGLFKRVAKDFINLPRLKKLDFKTGARAGSYNTPRLRTQKVTGVRPSAADIAAKRAAFGAPGGPRAQFLNQVRKDVSATDLQALGWSDEAIRSFKAGGPPPQGFAVHHRVPLQAGGTNDSGNLVLIRNDPDHDLITAQQNAVLPKSPGQRFER